MYVSVLVYMQVQNLKVTRFWRSLYCYFHSTTSHPRDHQLECAIGYRV